MAAQKPPAVDHSGHRDRMRKRYLETEFNGFHPHEVLEMMLFYCIPRKNTNELAHQLLARFGSLHAVLQTPPEILAQVSGISLNAAVLLSMFNTVCRYDIAEQQHGMVLDSYPKVCGYFRSLYNYEDREVVRAVMLDGELRAARCEVISEGHPSASTVSVRRLIEMAIRSNCNLMILAHNHPNGSLTVTPEDTAVTRQLVEILRKAAITLADHVLVANDDAISMREHGIFIGLEIE